MSTPFSNCGKTFVCFVTKYGCHFDQLNALLPSIPTDTKVVVPFTPQSALFLCTLVLYIEWGDTLWI